MERNLKSEERKCRRWYASIFQSCKHPVASVAELKLAVEESRYGKQVENHRWFQNDENAQENEVDLYITLEHAYDKLSKLCDVTKDELRSMFYRLPSTQIPTSELLHNMRRAKVGARRPGTKVNPVPNRNEYPGIVNMKFFVEGTLLNISWPQFKFYVNEFYRFCEIVGLVDDHLYLNQYYKTENHVPDHHKSNNRLKREIQDYHHKVSFVHVFETLATDVFYLNEVTVEVPKSHGRVHSVRQINESESHSFWSTSTGRIWYQHYLHEIRVKSESPVFFTWNDVYAGNPNWPGDNGISALLPNICRFSLDQIMNGFPKYYVAVDNPMRIRQKLGFKVGLGVMTIMNEDQTVPDNAEPVDLPVDDAQVVDSYVCDGNEDEENDDEEDDCDEPMQEQKKSGFMGFLFRSNQNNEEDEEDDVDEHQRKVSLISHKPLFFKQYRQRD